MHPLERLARHYGFGYVVDQDVHLVEMHHGEYVSMDGSRFVKGVVFADGFSLLSQPFNTFVEAMNHECVRPVKKSSRK